MPLGITMLHPQSHRLTVTHKKTSHFFLSCSSEQPKRSPRTPSPHPENDNLLLPSLLGASQILMVSSRCQIQYTLWKQGLKVSSYNWLGSILAALRISSCSARRYYASCRGRKAIHTPSQQWSLWTTITSKARNPQRCSHGGTYILAGGVINIL